MGGITIIECVWQRWQEGHLRALRVTHECVNPMGIPLMTKPWNPKLSLPPHWKLSLRHKNRYRTTHIQTTCCRLNPVSSQAHALNAWCPLGGTILGGSGNVGGGRLFRVSRWEFYPCSLPSLLDCDADNVCHHQHHHELNWMDIPSFCGGLRLSKPMGHSVPFFPQCVSVRYQVSNKHIQEISSSLWAGS